MIANLPKSLALRFAFYRKYKRKLNLKYPQTFEEHIQWLMMYSYGERESKCADKYYVRKYLESKNLGYIQPELYGHWSNARDIEFDRLPQQFVLKATHGCGFNVICRNKERLNKNDTIKFLNRCLRIDYSKCNVEPHYDKKLASIICEEFIESGETDILDYKIHCIKGKPIGILVCSERSKGLRLNWFDLHWNEQEDYITDQHRGMRSIKKPDNLEEMICIAEKIANDFVFVRVDLYNVKGNVKFSELTFTPQAGRIDYFTDKAQKELGEYFTKKM